MNYPADSTARLYQGGKGRYVGRGVPVDNCSREKCELVGFHSSTCSLQNTPAILVRCDRGQ